MTTIRIIIDSTDPLAGLVIPSEQLATVAEARERGARIVAEELLIAASTAGCGAWGPEELDALERELAKLAGPSLADLLSALRDLDDGTGDLGIIARQSLRDDPRATADDVRAIVLEARADAATERARA